MKRFDCTRIILVLMVFVLVLAPSSAKADFAFGEPVNLKTVIPFLDGRVEEVDCLSWDCLEMYISSYQRPGGQGDVDLWVLRRASTEDNWGSPENLGPAVNSKKEDSLASISVDGLTLYFSSNRIGADYDYDIYMTTRMTRDEPWGPAVNLGTVVNSYNHTDGEPWISPDGLELYFESYRPGGYGFSDIYVTRRATVNSPWGVPTNLGPLVNSEYHEQFLSLSPDGLVLLFGETRDTPWRPGGYGGADIWMTKRASFSDPWQLPVNLGPRINGPDRENIPRISPDGRTLYFCSNHGGAWNNYQAPIIPIVDFNSDGQIDGKDVLCMAARWGTDDAVCDIGPFAWGDGIVDLQDLVTLTEYLGNEFTDPTLVVHWALDETEGIVADDSAGNADAYIVGNPVWKPAGGQSGGAIELDGIDDCIVASYTLNPTEGPFSILAWIKGGAPGEVAISQTMGDNLLMADEESKLMSETHISTDNTEILPSGIVIADGQWHRIGLIWDGSRRTLCVDGIVAAEDTQGNLSNSGNGLYIGTGNAMAPGTYWSGLIDDVRIYNRAVIP